MSKIEKGLLYAESHEWVKVMGDGIVLIGISDYAQSQLGNIVFVDLPEEGDTLTAGEEFGAVESVKAASDLIAPVTGEVLEINEDLVSEPELVNEAPYDSWFLKVKLDDKSELDELLNPEDYEKFTK